MVVDKEIFSRRCDFLEHDKAGDDVEELREMELMSSSPLVVVESTIGMETFKRWWREDESIVKLMPNALDITNSCKN